MPIETTTRPVHVVAAEERSDRVPEMTGVLHAAGRTVLAHTLPGGLARAGELDDRERLRQEIALASGAVRAALADDGLLLLADGRASLVVPEMMSVLLDEQGMGWDEAWARVQGTVFARLGSPGDQPGPLWSTGQLEEECPRLLEILYEVNRRHLDLAEERWPGQVDHRRNVSLFREGEVKRLRLGLLTIVASARAEVAKPWGGPAAEILADLRELRGEALRPRPTPVRAPRWLQGANPSLAAAADLSNQASTAGSGAAGTRALAFAMNGAVTLGTRDGTVRELELAVGAENLFLFGLGPFETRAWREGQVYRPRDVYTIDPLVRRSVDELVSKRYAPEPGAHDWVRETLLDETDPWLVLADFGEYVHRQDEALAEFADPRTFTEKAILTLARCRRFWAGSLELDA